MPTAFDDFSEVAHVNPAGMSLEDAADARRLLDSKDWRDSSPIGAATSYQRGRPAEWCSSLGSAPAKPVLTVRSSEPLRENGWAAL